jgi:Zn-dependent protease
MNNFILNLIILAPPILMALTFHEFAHGYIAYRLGDPTAKNQGRLTLNPLKHLDPFGTLAFLILKFGWAKPVPVNPNYFQNPKKDMLWVALAGPATNLVLAIICGFLTKFTIGVYPLVAHFPFAYSILYPLRIFFEVSVEINLILCIFNFLPIPPLDGSKILAAILPPDMARSYASIERYGFIIILILIFSKVLSRVLFPIVDAGKDFLL